MDIISYFETFINSKFLLNKTQLQEDLKIISEQYFRGQVKIKMMNLPYGGWEIKAKGLRGQWVKAFVIDGGFTFKIYWCNSSEFLRWVATIIMHELAVKYRASVYSGRNLEITEPSKTWYKTFSGFAASLPNQKDVENLPKKLKKVFEIA